VRVIGYLRVSTEEQAESGHGLGAQRQAVLRHAEFHGWDVTFVEDAQTGENADREGLMYARHLLRTGQRDALAVTALDRLTWSLVDFADIVSDAVAEGWNLIVLDLNLDLSSPHGEFVANVLVAAARLQRQLIRTNTRNGLATARSKGVQLGRKPSPVPIETLRHIAELHGAGHNRTKIAHLLTNEGVPLPSGVVGVWSTGQVSRMLIRAARELTHV